MWSSSGNASQWRPRGQPVEASPEQPVLMHNSIVISARVNARCRTHKARARPSPPFAPGNSGLFVVAMAKLTGMHAPQRRLEYPSSMRVNARSLNHKHAEELQEFNVPTAQLVWTTLMTIVTPNAAVRIARESAKTSIEYGYPQYFVRILILCTQANRSVPLKHEKSAFEFLAMLCTAVGAGACA